MTALKDRVDVFVDDVPFDGWLGIDVKQSFDQVTGDGSLKIPPLEGRPMPILVGQRVRIVCAGRPVLTGRAHRVQGNRDNDTHALTIQVRDKTEDLRSSTIGPKSDFKPPVALGDVARTTIRRMGLDIPVIDKLGAAPFKQGEVVSGAIDEFGHAFLERWAQKRQGVLTTDGNGALVITSNRGEMASGRIIHGPSDNPANNVLRSSYATDDFDRANTYAVAGQKSPNDKTFWESRPKGEPLGQADPMANRYGVAHDPQVRPERRRHIRGGKGIEGKTPKDAAKWKANTLRAKSNEYTCEVQGFEQTPGGDIWWPGVLVPVYDWDWDLNTLLFLTEVQWKKTHESGAITGLKFTLKDAYDANAHPKGGGGGGSSGAAPGSFRAAQETGIGAAPRGAYRTVSPAEMGIDEAEVDEDQ